MKILLINPPRVAGYPVVREERFEHKDIGSVYPPLSLLHTAGLLEKLGHRVKLIDANGFDLDLLEIRRKIVSFKPEVVMIRAGFDTFAEDIKVLKMAKKLNKNISSIVRNHIISKTPWLKKEIIRKNKFIDVFLNQEPELSLPSLLGTPFKINHLDDLPFPAWHLLPTLKVYYSGTFGPPFVMIQGSRGCPFNCAFCAYGRQKYRLRSAGSIAEEIDWLVKNYNIHDFCFWDDVVTLDSDRMIKICQAIIKKKLKLRWSVGIRAETVNLEMMDYMKQAGCDEIAVGVESGSEEILKQIDKRETLKEIKKAAQTCHRLKMKFYAMFIIGLPGETKETVKQSIEFAKELKPFYTQFCFATPFPNTRIYKYYKKNRLLLTEDWSKYFPLSDEPVVRTKALSKKDLINLRNEAYRETLFNLRYLLGQVRLTDWRWNWRGFREIVKRIVTAVMKRPVR